MNTPNWFDVIGLRVRRDQIKDGGTPSSGEATIFEVSSGAGCILGLWNTIGALSGGYPGFDTIIKVYTDGSLTPDISQDLGVFFGYANGGDFSSGALATANFAATCDGWGKTSGLCLLPIPFTNGIKVTLTNPGSVTVGKLFTQISYALTADNPGWAPPPYRLHTDGVTVLSATAGPAASVSSFTLHSISGGPGIIVAHSMTAKSVGGTAGPTYLERNVALTIDGEGSPSFESSGTEDWWNNPWYFNWSKVSSPGAMSWGLATGSLFSGLVDFAAQHGGIAFASTAVMTWEKNADTTNDCSQYADCLFYYLHV